MISSLALAGGLSVLFAGGAVFAAAQLAGARCMIARTNHGLHLAMAMCMIVMVWVADWQLIPQLAVFLFATMWYVVWTGIHVARRNTRRGAVNAYHAGMMAGMALMLFAMWESAPAMHDVDHGHHEMASSYVWLGVALPVVGGAMSLATASWLRILAGHAVGRAAAPLRRQRVRHSAYEAATAAGMAIMLLSAH